MFDKCALKRRQREAIEKAKRVQAEIEAQQAEQQAEQERKKEEGK